MMDVPIPARRIALDVVPAAMLAAAVGFIAAVAPIDLIERVVVRSGLPSLMSAAAPPLGVTARAAMVAGSSAATFAAVRVVLRLVGRARVAGNDARAADEPPLRAADRHPDAPPRRPFSAGEALAAAAPPFDPVAPAVRRAPRPLEQRTITELIATLEERMLGGAANDVEGPPTLDRGRG